MNILVTLDENYLNPLRTMLWSLHQAEPDLPRRGADTGKNTELVDSCVHGYGEGIVDD